MAEAGPLALFTGRGHEVLDPDVYVEVVAAGGPAEQRYPGIAAHLRACGPCGEDFEGLLAAVRGEAD